MKGKKRVRPSSSITLDVELWAYLDAEKVRRHASNRSDTFRRILWELKEGAGKRHEKP